MTVRFAAACVCAKDALRLKSASVCNLAVAYLS